MEYPKRTEQTKHEDSSVAKLKDRYNDLGVIREVNSRDFGIDIEFEVENKGAMEGHFIKVQLKSSDDLYLRNDGHATVGNIKMTTLNYWAEISRKLPVVGVAVDVVTDAIYVSDLLFWQVITLIEPNGYMVSIDDKGNEKKTLITKTIDFGSCHNDNQNMSKLRRYAYAPSINEQIGAMKWLLRKYHDILDLYADADTLDRFYPTNEPELFQSLLDNAKIILTADENYNHLLDKFLDYEYYEYKSNGDEPYNYEIKLGLDKFIKKLLDRLVHLKAIILDAGYYWATTDPKFLKLVFESDITSFRDTNEILDYACDNYGQRKASLGNIELFEYVQKLEKKYNINGGVLLS